MFKDFKDIGSVLKSYSELKSMIGKPRFDVPPADAADDVKGAFWEKMGVPKEAKDYGFKPEVNYPEMNTPENAKFLNEAFAPVAHELKLSTTQALGLQKFMDDLSMKYAQQMTDKIKADDVVIDAFFKKTFGDQEDAVVASVQSEIKSFVPPEIMSQIGDKLNPEAMSVIALMDQHYKKKYGVSDENIGQNGTPSAGKNQEALQAEGRRLLGEMQKVGPMDAKYAELKLQYDNVYKQIGDLTRNTDKR